MCVAESKEGFLCVQVSVPIVIMEKGGDPGTPADLKSAKKGGDLSTPAAAANQMGSGRALHGALHALHKGQKHS